MHEVHALSAVVAEACAATCSHVVVDVGAGAGYLATTLYFLYGLSVVALEGNSDLADRAAERSRKMTARLGKRYGTSCYPPSGPGPSPPLGEAGQGVSSMRPILHHTAYHLSSAMPSTELARLVEPALCPNSCFAASPNITLNLTSSPSPLVSSNRAPAPVLSVLHKY